ncbi:MAG: glycosyltransferase [Acidimicrobiales bacterium]|nr:glycosyltransferase [Acidimicrobiales bacterium]
MFPFWDIAVAPVLQAAGARRVVEIGALRGETTAFMLNELGSESELHVIDPVPVFDPSEHEQRFPGRYIFHRALSLDVLPDLPAMDAALIDGDHNWYTVYNELKALSDTARKADQPLPVMILHDVGWPYGRRDLYYVPEQIPEDHRQPYEQKGMVPGVSELVESGGLNPTNCNATHEGGPRNGVMTAVDDFIAEYDRTVRLVFLPAYFGLAIVVEEALLAQRPELGEKLDWLESSEGQAALVEMAESVRIDSLMVQHNVFYTDRERTSTAGRRYLGLLKGALLNEHYLEQEVRISYLLECLDRGIPPRPEALRDPGRQLTEELEQLRTARTAGVRHDDANPVGSAFPYTPIGRERLDRLEDLLETIHAEDVAGDLVDVGTGRGGVAMLFRGFLEAYGITVPRVWVVDRFRARPLDSQYDAPPPTDDEPTDPADESAPASSGTHAWDVVGGPGLPELQGDLNSVREGFHRFGLLDDQVRFVPGSDLSVVDAAPIDKVALIHIGADADFDVEGILTRLYPRLSLGGFVVIDGVADQHRRAAIDAIRAHLGSTEPIHALDHGTLSWRKTETAKATGEGDEPSVLDEAALADRPAGPVLAPPRGWIPTDLTVVVVFYNMKREAARTLHSLSRAYQRGLGDITYDVVVVDNGSKPEQKLDEAFVQSFGREFRFVDMGEDARPSPIPALNRGIAEGKGTNFALMIDGAHVLTPGVLRHGLSGLRTYEPAVVATQQWYVGPGDQADVVAEGYDKDYEDKLFETINWPADGYKLFDIGHFIGNRDWFDGMWESNCVFVPRAQLEQAGGFDERFSMPGGGYANLDLYERIGASPDVTVVSILGEGSFHQVHGGTTTNLAGEETRHATLGGYSEHYTDMQGRSFRGNAKPVHYVGSMPREAARTKARRRVSPNLFSLHAPDQEGGVPVKASPLPDDLWSEFTESYWNTLKWRQTHWMGRRLAKLPGDMVILQEIVHSVRPDWIIHTGTANGGLDWFLATICDLIDHGQIVSVDRKLADDLPEHPRIHYVEGEAHLTNTRGKVMEITGADPHTMVILGSKASSARTSAEYHNFEDLVSKDSYLVIEDTIVGGHPVWPNFGVGPFEARKGVTEVRGDFVADTTLEKYGLSFNPTGYLKRVRKTSKRRFMRKKK